jgi:hypothetical protein
MYELVAVKQAAHSTVYPGEGYWHGPVTRACQQAFDTYVGRPHAAGPTTAAGRSSAFFQPKSIGWAHGDRTVYCVAHSSTATPGSVRHVVG